MMVRPPRAKDFMTESTWKPQALSSPLEKRHIAVACLCELRKLVTSKNPQNSLRQKQPINVADVLIYRPNPFRFTVACRRVFSRANKLPGGLIQKHDWRVVDQLQPDGESLALTSGEAVGTSICTSHQTKSHQDLVHLRCETRTHSTHAHTHIHKVGKRVCQHCLETFFVASLTSFFFTCMLSFSFRLAEALRDKGRSYQCTSA